MIQDDVIDRRNGNGHRTVTQRIIPPDNPGAVLDRLGEWAARLDELTTEYAEVMEELGVKRHVLEYEKSCARERAKRRPNPMDRRTTADLDADVTRSAQVRPLEEAVIRLEARRDALRELMSNARMQIAALRTNAETTSVINPWST